MKIEGFPLKWKFGNLHFWIQHTWNMKVSLSYHFYQKMPSHLFSRPFSQESYQSITVPKRRWTEVCMLSLFADTLFERCWKVVNWENIDWVCPGVCESVSAMDGASSDVEVGGAYLRMGSARARTSMVGVGGTCGWGIGEFGHFLNATKLSSKFSQYEIPFKVNIPIMYSIPILLQKCLRWPGYVSHMDDG